MSNMCDNFIMYEDNQSDFKMWQGLVGAHYTPYVDSIGNLSWTNNGGLPNPSTVNIAGKGLNIVGIVDEDTDLPETASNFDTYLVGTEDPYSAYIYDNGTWYNLGIIGQGEKGDPGEGVPSGGSTGQVLAKASGADYDTEWKTPDPGVNPATSAPLMDGTAAVGTSTKYAREDHVHPVYDQIVRPNLLDNWYFVGGGSQQGDGKFPINQRGQTVYSSNGFCLDRWQTEGSLTISSGYVTTGNVFLQGCETGLMNALLGKTVTLSCLRADGTLVSGQITLPGSYPGSVTKYQAATGLYMALYSGGGGQIFRIEGSQNIVAVKLELGTTQTLAHQENGVWVLNEIPDYNDEILKCQRYYFKLMDETNYLGQKADGNKIRMQITALNMAKSPTVSATDFYVIDENGASTLLSVSTVSVRHCYPNCIMLEIIPTTTFSYPDWRVLQISVAGTWEVAAEL